MKNKYIHLAFVLSITVFVWVAFLGAKNARADWNRTCSGTAPGECVMVYVPGSTVADYTIKAFVGFDANGDELPVNPGASWPIQDFDTGYAIFRYITGVTVPDSNVSAQSYSVFDWPSIPSGGTPSGAQQDRDSLWADCNANISVGRVAWQLNRVSNKKKDGIIDIYMPLGTSYDDTCGQVFIKWGGYCDGGYIWVAERSGISSTLDTYSGCGYTVTVERNECTGIPTTVSCTGPSSGVAVLHPDAVLCSSDTSSDDCFEIDPSLTPAVICTNGAPIFVYDTSMWFCPNPLN